MTDTNATTLRNALASAIKNHVSDSGLTAKDAATKSGVQLSRLYQVLRGDVEKISSDALVNILGGFGYRLTGINGSGNGTEIVLSLDKTEGHVLPEIEKPERILVKVSDAMASRIGGYESENFKSGESGWKAGKDGVLEINDHKNGECSFENAVESDPDTNRVVSDDE